MRLRLLPVALATFLVLSGPGAAEDLVYEPVNPSFGGNPFNSAHLNAVANAQNKFRDPATDKGRGSQADVFARQLQSRLLSALSSQIVDAIFGENPQEYGVIRFGEQTIEFTRGLEEVTLVISDDVGSETTIVVPTFLEVN